MSYFFDEENPRLMRRKEDRRYGKKYLKFYIKKELLISICLGLLFLGVRELCIIILK